MESCTPLLHDPEDKKVLIDEEDDDEPALSLCDLPVSDYEESPRPSSHLHRKPSSQPQQFFEFFSDISCQMSSAEDIILHGKLKPFKQLQYPTPSLPLLKTKISKTQFEEPQKVSFRSKSTPSLDKVAMLREGGGDVKRSSSLGRIRRSDEITSTRMQANGKVVAKTRWCRLMFGKPPNYGNMELKDIKNRQSRRNPSAMFMAMDVSGKKPPAGESFGKGPCRFLRVFSCKNDTSVAVASPLYIPQAY